MRASATTASTRSPAARLAALVAAVVTVAVFASAIRPDLLLWWDDHDNLVDNTHYRGLTWTTVRWAFTTFHSGPYQPLSWLSYTVDHAIWGEDWRGYYATNVLLQAACAALLSMVTWRLLPKAVPGIAERAGLRAAIAGGASLLWAVHPLRVESVVWATERRDVLSAAFLLAAVLAWLSYCDGDVAGKDAGRPWWKRGAYWRALALFVASLLSKATAMGFVLVLVLLDRYPLRRSVRDHIAEKIPFALAGVGAAVLAAIGQRHANAALAIDDVPLLGRAVIAGFAATHYLAQTFVPAGLRAHYARPGTDELFRADLVAGCAVAVVLAAAVIVLRKRLPPVATALGAYAVLLAPVSGLATVGSQLVADRYSHQPTMALSVLAAGGIAWLIVRAPEAARPRITQCAVGALAAVVVALAAASVRLTLVWRDPEALWNRVLEFEPGNWVAHQYLGKVEFDRRRFDAAAAHLDRSMGGVAGTVFYAAWLRRDGDLDDAEHLIESAVARAPSNADAWKIKGSIAETRGDDAGAEAAYRKGVEAEPESLPPLESLLAFLAGKGRGAEVEPLARKMCERHPKDAAARAFLGVVLATNGAKGDAEAVLREAIALDPHANVARANLAALYANNGRPDVAWNVLQDALAAGPVPAASLELLALLATQRGSPGDAADYAVRASALATEQPEVLLRAAGALSRAGRQAEAREAAETVAVLAHRMGNRALESDAKEFLRLMPE